VRRHPLIQTLTRLGAALALGVALIGCRAMNATTSATPAGIRVAVSTAPGEMLAFDPAEIEVGSVVPVTLTFRNGSSVAHNLTFTSGLSVATRTIVEPGAVEELHLVPPAAGTYPFVCTIHAEMTGQLVVAPASR
jgi:plastocyanin